jgi:hypothetical protein
VGRSLSGGSGIAPSPAAVWNYPTLIFWAQYYVG